MLQRGLLLRNDQPIVQITKEVHTPQVCPIRNHSKGSDKYLWSRGQAEAQSTKLVEMPLETKPEVRPRVQMNGNLEVGIFEVYQELPVPLPDRPQDQCHCLHLKLSQQGEANEGRQIDNWPPDPRHLLHKEEMAVEALAGLVNNLQHALLDHLVDLLPKEPVFIPTLENKTKVPEAPATKVGHDGMAPYSHNGAQQSTPWCLRTAKHTNAARVHFPPAAVREAGNLQNFFPLPQ